MSVFEKTPSQPEDDQEIIGEFPCTQTQLRCWILNQLNPGNPGLNVAVRWEIRGNFKAATLEAAFRKIIQRHEVLRTRIVEKDGRPYQQVVKSVDFKMPVIDLRNMTPETRKSRVPSIGEETARVPFDLGKAGLFRVTLLMMENDVGVLLITAHQSCFDGWSIRVLGRELGEIAAAIDAGRTPDVPELALQYGDYALWQAEYLESYGFETESTFWREKLTDVPYFEVQPDRPRGPVKTTNADLISILQPMDFGDRIDAAARKARVSLYSYGAAVISAMLHRLTGDKCVLFGSNVAGREDTDLENLIGVFINTLVLKYDIGGDPTFTEHVHAANEMLEGVLAHQRMPFNELVGMINPPRDPSRNPLISVNFNLSKAFLEDRRYGEFELISAPSQSPGVIYDLSFMMVGRPSGWRMSIEYNTDLFDRATIETFLRYWKETYDAVLADPEVHLSALTVPLRAGSPAEARRLDPGSVEGVLRSHPAVGEAAVISAGGETGSVAFVVPSPTCDEALDQLPALLMRHLEAQVPAAKLPKEISVLMRLPKTADGSVDRSALRLPAKAPAAPVAAAKPKNTASLKADPEKMAAVAAIWKQVLNVPSVEPGSDFFALGGHSLLALRMLSAVREKFEEKPNLELLFREPTLERFTGAVFGVSQAAPAKAEPVEAPAVISGNPWELMTCKQGSGASAVYTLNHPFLYYKLAGALPENTPVYNVNMFNARLDDALAGKSFEEIAALAIEAMEIPPQVTSVAIVGLCVNGILAFEIARQLREAGKEVQFTAMIDAWAPGYFRAQPKLTQKRWNMERRVKRSIYFTQKVLGGRMRLIDYLKEFNLTLGLLRFFGVRKGEYSPEEVANEAVTGLLVRASRQYKPAQTQDPSIVFLRSEAHHPRAAKLRFGWGDAVAKDTAVVSLSGWHEDSLGSDGIRELASAISKKLESQSAQ